MTHPKEGKMLVLTLLITMGCLGAGYQVFRSFESASDSAQELTSPETVDEFQGLVENAVETRELAIAPDFDRVAPVPVGLFNYGGSTTWAPDSGLDRF